jgi:hypothetical protein
VAPRGVFLSLYYNAQLLQIHDNATSYRQNFLLATHGVMQKNQ